LTLLDPSPHVPSDISCCVISRSFRLKKLVGACAAWWTFGCDNNLKYKLKRYRHLVRSAAIAGFLVKTLCACNASSYPGPDPRFKCTSSGRSFGDCISYRKLTTVLVRYVSFDTSWWAVLTYAFRARRCRPYSPRQSPHFVSTRFCSEKVRFVVCFISW
jgi:hypothetical protein